LHTLEERSGQRLGIDSAARRHHKKPVIRSIVWLGAAGLLVAGCDLRPDLRESSDAGAASTGQATSKDPAGSRGRAAASGGRTAGSAAASDQNSATAATSVRLSSGATLQLPPGAKTGKPPRALPKQVKAVHVFRFGDGNRRLVVNELARDGKTCGQLLDEEWKRMQAAKKDKDEGRLLFRRIGHVEQLKAAGRRVLYSRSKQRRLAKSDAGLTPMIGMASASMCHADDFVVVLFASKNEGLPAGTKAMIVKLLASYKAPAKK